VKAAGLPINIAGSKLVDKIDRCLRASQIAPAQGLVEIDAPKTDPHWTAKTSFWCTRCFRAARRSSSSTANQPVTGQFFFGLSDLTSKEYARSYCIDARRRRASARGSRCSNRRVRTASTFRLSHGFRAENRAQLEGPDRRFHLTLDSSSRTMCCRCAGAGDLKKTGPHNFRIHARQLRARARHQVAGAE